MEEFTRINVARKIAGKTNMHGNPCYEHHFRIDINEPPSHPHFKQVHSEIKAAFPEPNFKVDVTRWNIVGHPIEM